GLLVWERTQAEGGGCEEGAEWTRKRAERGQWIHDGDGAGRRSVNVHNGKMVGVYGAKAEVPSPRLRGEGGPKGRVRGDACRMAPLIRRFAPPSPRKRGEGPFNWSVRCNRTASGCSEKLFPHSSRSSSRCRRFRPRV